MNLHERFQTHCRFCHKVFEADSNDDVIALAVAHEHSKHNLWLNRRPATMDDFYA